MSKYLVCCILLMFMIFVFGFTDTAIEATVDPEIIAITIDRTNVSYGPRQLGNTATSGEIIITNTGNVPVKISACGSNSTGPNGESWELKTTLTPGNNQYTHSYSFDASNFSFLLPTLSQIAVLTPETNQSFYLLLKLPPAGSNFSGRHTVPVTIRAAKN